MEPNIQIYQNIEVVTKKEPSLRTVLNVIGIFIFCGIFLTIITVPISFDETTGIYTNESLKLDSKKLKEFIQFTFGSATIYFILVNLYFLGGLFRKVFFVSLILLCVFSVYTVFSYLISSIPH